MAVASNNEDCPRKCSSVLLPFDDPPFCGWTDDDHEAGNCANEIIHEDINKFRISNDHKRPCHILEYKGKVKFKENIAEAKGPRTYRSLNCDRHWSLP